MTAAGAADPAESRVGTTIAGRYFLHQLVGRGGAGEVYRATWLGPERTVAVKLLGAGGDDDAAARSFEREAAAAARLSHPHSVEVLDFGRTPEGLRYLVTAFVEGLDLARLLAAGGPLPPARAARIAGQVLEVLASAHAAGIIHRDLKPANVMVEPGRAPGDHVTVLDFGIATVAPPGGDPARTQEGLVLGTPAYMSPEQLRGEPLDARCDLHAVGVLLHELLAGAPPFVGPTPVAVAAQVLTATPPTLSSARPGLVVPAALEALVRQALAKDREDRPASAAAMRAALEAAVAGLPAPAAGAPRLPPTEAFAAADLAPRPRPSRRRAALALGAAALLLLAAGALVLPRTARAPGDALAPATSTGVSIATPASAPAAPAEPGPAAPDPRQEPEPTAPRSEQPAGRPEAAALPPRAASPAGPRPAPRATPSAPPAPPRPEPPPIRLVRGELNAIATPPAATGDGVLVLQATPWAEVSVAGTPLGETPREVRLGAGAFTVRAVHPELGAREAVVQIRPGERTLLTVRFEQPPPSP